MSHAESKRKGIEEVERLLLAGWWSVSELAKQVNRDRSTIHRWLQEIEQEHPLETDGKGNYHLDPMLYINNVRLSSAEALGIYLAMRRFVRQTSKAPLFFSSAVQKVALALRHPGLVNVLAQSSLLLDSERPAAPDHSAIWHTLIRAWLEHVVVQIVYQKHRDDKQTTHLFEPYLFEPAVLSHGVYVIGWSRTREKIRTFKIDRIQRASLTSEFFEEPETLAPDELLKNAWGIWYGQQLTRVELRFAPDVARRVQETIWHPSQEITIAEDGSLYWSVEIAGTLELVAWIRGWGHEVEVLAPPELRKKIAVSLRAAADLYEE